MSPFKMKWNFEKCACFSPNKSPEIIKFIKYELNHFKFNFIITF